MCDYCSRTFPECEAKPWFAREAPGPILASARPDAVLACDNYESPVDVLKRQFH